MEASTTTDERSTSSVGLVASSSSTTLIETLTSPLSSFFSSLSASSSLSDIPANSNNSVVMGFEDSSRSPTTSPPLPPDDVLMDHEHAPISPLETVELEWLMRPLRILPHIEHSLVEKIFSKPKICNVCREFLMGSDNTGYSCEVCKCVVHSACLINKQKLPSCQLNPSPVSPHVNPPTLQAKRRHHWLEGNFKSGSICNSCKEPLNFFFEDIRCSRCHLTFHAECLAKMGSSQSSLTTCRPLHNKLLYRRPLKPTDNKDEDDDDLEIEEAPMPLVVFVNSRSGAQKGPVLLMKFKHMFGLDQVFDLSDGGPAPALERFKEVPNTRVLVCGGDGSVGWVLQHIFSPTIGIAPHMRPPVGVLPLGTGNDMSQTLEWGIEYCGEPLHDLLTQIEQAHPVNLDRWSVGFEPVPEPLIAPNEGSILDYFKFLSSTTEPSQQSAVPIEQLSEIMSTSPRTLNEAISSIPPDLSLLAPKDAGPRTDVMNNYLSIGWDAKVSLDFHSLRETNSYLCQSRLGNKFIYTLYGVKQMLFEQGWHLENKIRLEIDGKEYKLPDSLEGLIVLNLPSYAGGSDLWGPHDDDEDDEDEDKQENTENKLRKPRIDDQLLEFVGIAGCLHMGSIQVNLTTATRIGQGHQARITWKTNQILPMQIDGEPFVQKPCSITFNHLNQVKMLTPRSDDESSDDNHEDDIVLYDDGIVIL